MSKREVWDHIKAHRDEHVARIQEFVRQPSVSATGQGITESADQVADYLRALGCQEVEIVPTEGHPTVFAYYDAGAEKTIVNYGFFDVTVVNPDEWDEDPFSGSIQSRDGFSEVLYGRGAYTMKGQWMAWINALESIKAVEGDLPVNIYFIVEGEEEIGSPNVQEVIEKYADRMRTADATMSLGMAQDRAGEISMSLGNKGFLYFQLEASGSSWGKGPAGGPVHGSVQTIVDSPSWRLIDALSTLADENGRNIKLPGFSSKLREPSSRDMELLADIADRKNTTDLREVIPLASGPGEIQNFVDDLHGLELLKQYLFSPTFNINGIYGGFTGPGTRTFSLPDRAACSIDIRLIPDQEPEEVLQSLRDHLDSNGFTDVQIHIISNYTWAKTEVDEDIVQSTLRAYERLGVKPLIWPSHGASGPWYLFNRILGLPTLKNGGLGWGSGRHAANEYLVIEGNDKIGGLVESEQSHVEILYSYAAYPNDYE